MQAAALFMDPKSDPGAFSITLTFTDVMVSCPPPLVPTRCLTPSQQKRYLGWSPRARHKRRRQRGAARGRERGAVEVHHCAGWEAQRREEHILQRRHFLCQTAEWPRRANGGASGRSSTWRGICVCARDNLDGFGAPMHVFNMPN